mmetsp:Transcript_14267/g.33975  ORF Transcript_14267/g.33975 Transcript_14267/m.33975 type:complete len:219 (+) Transcript_14267:44-700(+)
MLAEIASAAAGSCSMLGEKVADQSCCVKSKAWVSSWSGAKCGWRPASRAAATSGASKLSRSSASASVAARQSVPKTLAAKTTLKDQLSRGLKASISLKTMARSLRPLGSAILSSACGFPQLPLSAISVSSRRACKQRPQADRSSCPSCSCIALSRMHPFRTRSCMWIHFCVHSLEESANVPYSKVSQLVQSLSSRATRYRTSSGEKASLPEGLHSSTM